MKINDEEKVKVRSAKRNIKRQWQFKNKLELKGKNRIYKKQAFILHSFPAYLSFSPT